MRMHIVLINHAHTTRTHTKKYTHTHKNLKKIKIKINKNIFKKQNIAELYKKQRETDIIIIIIY